MHDGPSVEDGHIFLTYTQLEDPSRAGHYESFTCQSVYSKEKDFADLEAVVVRNYYGKGRFSETFDPEEPDLGLGFMDINFEDLVDD